MEASFSTPIPGKARGDGRQEISAHRTRIYMLHRSQDANLEESSNGAVFSTRRRQMVPRARWLHRSEIPRLRHEAVMSLRDVGPRGPVDLQIHGDGASQIRKGWC